MPLKIMVVDDEVLSTKAIRALAVPLGHSVTIFNDSQEATQQAGKQRFDLIFVGMPRPDGLDLAQKIHQSQSNSDITVVLLSPADDNEICRKAFGAGVALVLPKPIVAARIIRVLTAMESPGWKMTRHAARVPLFVSVTCKSAGQDFSMRTLNISESGMLLQSSHDVEVGQDMMLNFRLAEVGASLNVRVRVVRKEEKVRVGVEFMGLAPEDQNAIQLYVMGGLKGAKAPPNPSDLRLRRFWSQT